MDWIALFEDNHIEYVTHSPNTKKGNVNIRCPWCREDDPSQHLGVSLSDAGYACWRNAMHRGKSPSYLIKVLLGCSASQALLVAAQYSQTDPEALGNLETAPEAPVKPAGQLKMPTEFRPIPPTGRFFDYLKQRGFDAPHWVGEAYGLKCCSSGRWKDRIIIPVWQNGKLVAWTGRALQDPILAPRYLSTSEIIKTVIFNDNHIAKGGNCLFVTEGPFDAMKVDYYGYNQGAKATAVFGTSITMDQISILREITKRFKKTVLLFDTDATETTFNMADWLPGAIIGNLPDGVSDPGELSKDQVKALVNQY